MPCLPSLGLGGPVADRAAAEAAETAAGLPRAALLAAWC